MKKSKPIQGKGKGRKSRKKPKERPKIVNLGCGCNWDGRKWEFCGVAKQLFSVYLDKLTVEAREIYSNHFKSNQ